MTAAPPKFCNILNFRDVGQTINSVGAGPTTDVRLKTGLLFRSARPDTATSTDRSLILDHYKIKTIIDLRSKTEHINAAKKHSDAVAIAQSAAVPTSDDLVSMPLQIPGIAYSETNLNGKGFERALLWKLKWSSLAKLISYMALGYRTEGIAILGSEVMKKRGLIGLGIDTLEFSGKEIHEAFNTLINTSSYPVLIHCTQGKDRTGLLILLLLLLCGVPIQSITQDYMMSEAELEPEKAERIQEIKSIGLDESFAGCPPNFVPSVVSHINDHYGGIASYLSGIGVSADMQKTLRDFLVCNA